MRVGGRRRPGRGPRGGQAGQWVLLRSRGGMLAASVELEVVSRPVAGIGAFAHVPRDVSRRDARKYDRPDGRHRRQLVSRRWSVTAGSPTPSWRKCGGALGVGHEAPGRPAGGRRRDPRVHRGRRPGRSWAGTAGVRRAVHQRHGAVRAMQRDLEGHAGGRRGVHRLRRGRRDAAGGRPPTSCTSSGSSAGCAACPTCSRPTRCCC